MGRRPMYLSTQSNHRRPRERGEKVLPRILYIGWDSYEATASEEKGEAFRFSTCQKQSLESTIHLFDRLTDEENRATRYSLPRLKKMVARLIYYLSLYKGVTDDQIFELAKQDFRVIHPLIEQIFLQTLSMNGGEQTRFIDRAKAFQKTIESYSKKDVLFCSPSTESISIYEASKVFESAGLEFCQRHTMINTGSSTKLAPLNTFEEFVLDHLLDCGGKPTETAWRDILKRRLLEAERALRS